MLRGVARAVTRAAVRAPAAWARAPVSEHRRAMSLMVSQNFAKTVAQKAATEPHVDAVKMHTDDAEPVRYVGSTRCQAGPSSRKLLQSAYPLSLEC